MPYRIGQTRTLAAHMAGKIDAWQRCKANHSQYAEWEQRHSDAIRAAIDCLPHGSGIDGQTMLNEDKSNGERVAVDIGYHHMDEYGGYDGWTHHTVSVKASLHLGLLVSVSGRDRNGIKDYLASLFSDAFDTEYTEVFETIEQRASFVLPEHVAALEVAS
jgi:hypothetical protein